MASRVPKPSTLYWICQAAGWAGFLAYVLGFYLYYARCCYNRWAVISIVVFCTVVPIVMTHAARHWMYRHQWMLLSGLRRRLQMVATALAFAVSVSVGVGIANGLPQGRLFVPTEGFWWMVLAYDMAFGGWMAAYSVAQGHRQRQELEAVAREAQLRALRAQLNPHFLFNSLNAVRGLISENPPRAMSMVTGISDILRYSLTADRKDTVSFADELAIIDEYIAVERARFDERLRMEKSIDARVLQAQVPPMLVQTLVENAVKHGVAASVHGGFVRLEAGAVNGHLRIVVSNSGGFSPDADATGFGLQNAVERLRLTYGGRASLTVKGDGDSTTAELTLPLDGAS